MSTTPVRQPGASRRRVPGVGWPRGLVWLLVAVLVGGGVGTAARAFDIRPVRVTSGSMSPTIKIGDWIVTRDLDRADRRSLHRGDIVVLRFPLGTPGRAVKRVVAIGGDRVAISARTVTVNARVIPIADAPSAGAARTRVETIPPNHVFLLGDNPASSIDSRSFGPVPETEIIARELLTIGTPGWMSTIAAIAVTICALVLLVAWRRHHQPRGNDAAIA
jgi:signal peptidase I